MSDEKSAPDAFDSAGSPEGTNGSRESISKLHGADSAGVRDVGNEAPDDDENAHAEQSASNATPEDRLDVCLAPDESLDRVANATVEGPAFDSEAIVGLTDRRLLAVGVGDAADAFVGAKREAVQSVRSHVTTVYSLRSVDVRAVALVAFVTAVVGFAGLLGTTRDPITPMLALVAVGGVLAIDHLRRESPESGRSPAVHTLRRAVEATPMSDRWTRYIRSLSVTGFPLGGRSHSLGPLGLAVGFFSLVLPVTAIAVLTPSVATALFFGLLIAGICLILYAHHNYQSLQGFDVARRRRRITHVTLRGGDLVTIRTDPDCRLDHDLSRAADVGSGRYSRTLSRA